MILAWMIYTSAATLLLALAAWSFEQVAWQRGWPLRGVWALALLGSIAIPAGALLTRGPEAGAPAPVAASAPALGGVRRAWPAPMAASAPAEWDRRLLALWAVASTGVSLALILSYWTLRGRRREWTAREVDGRTVWLSPDTGPAVVGIRESRIVLPTWVLELGGSERALILSHEEEHVRARDPRLLLAGLLLVSAFPWNGALWWITRRLRQAVEVDCDRRVLARGADPRAYGRLLMEVAHQGSGRHVAVVALSESPSFLERRIRLMLTSQPHRWTRAAGRALLASVLVTGACRMTQPPRLAARTMLWLSDRGTYHIGDPTSPAIPLERLPGALRAALARTSSPDVLNVAAYEGAGGYEYIMARQAACEAGVRRMEVAGRLPVGARDASGAPADMRGTETLQPPCRPGPQRPDTALAR